MCTNELSWRRSGMTNCRSIQAGEEIHADTELLDSSASFFVAFRVFMSSWSVTSLFADNAGVWRK